MTGTSGYHFEYDLHLIKIPSHLDRESIYNFCGLQACVPLVVFTMWLCFSCVLVHNNKCVEQTVFVLTYTLIIVLLKIVVLGVVGAKDFEYRFYFFVCARLKRENLSGKTYFTQTFAN